MALVAVIYVVGLQLTSNKTGAGSDYCNKPGPTHTVIIRGNIINPQHTEASRCDRLTIINEDDAARLMAFGNHDHHQAYDGVTEQLLKQGQSLTVTLKQTGTFTFHDHLHDEVEGSFTVADAK